MYRLSVKSHFDAAHHLEGHNGKCARVHGHRWEYEVTVESLVLDKLNMVVDFSRIKACCRDLEESYLDHWDLNESLSTKLPTAEYLAKWIFIKFTKSIRSISPDLELKSVKVWESPECCVEYRED
jgi:6-pyruvoyltetrahydropterin/6-carboxytetrahydropterin synthase